MRFRAHHAAILALAGASACQEPPSYRLRWAIEGREQPDGAEPTVGLDVAACSEAGLFQVRARAYSDSGVYVDERLYPCFSAALANPEGMVDGVTLPPGRYAIELRGVDRTGDPWEGEPTSVTDEDHPGCVPGGPSECRPTELVCDCQPLEVLAEGAAASAPSATAVQTGSTIDLPEFVLVAPPECVDGIDNDLDGLVDTGDPSCNVDFGDGTEGVAVGVTELRIDVTFLGRNAAATCNSVPLRRLRLAVGEGDAQEVVLEGPCQTDRPYVALVRLPAGLTTFTVTGYDGIGTAARPADPVTHPKTFVTEISEFGGTVARSVDFAAEDFIEPIVEPIRVRPVYVSEVGPGADPRFSCEPPTAAPGTARGQLTLDALRMQVLDARGNPLDVPVTSADGTVLDGTSVLPCDVSLTTAPLAWGGYSVVLEALSAEGEVCFSNVGTPQLMAPSGSELPIYLARHYLEDGTVPASCLDCAINADCNLEDELACVNGVCQRRCDSDSTDTEQCLSDELGDLGFVCEDDVCQPG